MNFNIIKFNTKDGSAQEAVMYVKLQYVNTI